MRFKLAGNKRDVVSVVIRNAESLITIKQGAPVFLAANGTDNGLAVVSANNLAAALQANFYGLALTDINPSAYGEACVFGFYDTARLRLTTRADSTSTWASYTAGAIGDIQVPVTGTGGAASSLACDQAMSRSASGVYTINMQVRLMETYASVTTQASSLTGSLITDASCTASVAAYKVFCRVM